MSKHIAAVQQFQRKHLSILHLPAVLCCTHTSALHCNLISYPLGARKQNSIIEPHLHGACPVSYILLLLIC